MYTIQVHQFGQVMLIAVGKLSMAISNDGGLRALLAPPQPRDLAGMPIGELAQAGSFSVALTLGPTAKTLLLAAGFTNAGAHGSTNYGKPPQPS